MNDEEFNFFKLGKCEKDVVLPALREVHTSLWDRKFPTKLWQWNEASVKWFEQEEEQNFEIRIKDKSNNEKKKERYKRKDKNSKIRGDENGGDLNAKWRSANWDTCKLCHVLVDSKLFKLEEINDQLSDHIVNLRKIRNKTAHFTAYAISNEILADNVKKITDHINGLTCVIKTDQYLNIIQEIKNSQKPESLEQQAKLKQEYEALKHLCQLQVHEKELSNVRVMLLQERDKNEQLKSERKEKLGKVYKDLEQEREKYVTLGEKLQQERDKYAKLEEKFQGDKEKKKKETKGKMDQLNRQKESTEKELKMSQHENQAKGEEITKMKDEIAKLKRSLEQEQRENKNQVAGMLIMKDEISELKKEKLELEFEKKSKEKNIQTLEFEISNLKKQNSSLIEENNHLKDQRSQMLNNNYDLKQKVKKALTSNNNQSWENKKKDREILKLKEENENLNRILCKSNTIKDIQVENLEKVKEENKHLKWANATVQIILFTQATQKNKLEKENHMLRQNLEQVFETIANNLHQSAKISMQDFSYNTSFYYTCLKLYRNAELYVNSENSQERENLKNTKFFHILGRFMRPRKDTINRTDEYMYLQSHTQAKNAQKPLEAVQNYLPTPNHNVNNMQTLHLNTNMNSFSEQISTLREKCDQSETENKQLKLRLSEAESTAEQNETEMLKLQHTISRLENNLHGQEKANKEILEKLRTETELRIRQSNESQEEINHLKHELLRLQRENQRPRHLPEDSSTRQEQRPRYLQEDTSIIQENALLRERVRKMEEKLKHAKKMLHSQIDDFFDGN